MKIFDILLYMPFNPDIFFNNLNQAEAKKKDHQATEEAAEALSEKREAFAIEEAELKLSNLETSLADLEDRGKQFSQDFTKEHEDRKNLQEARQMVTELERTITYANENVENIEKSPQGDEATIAFNGVIQTFNTDTVRDTLKKDPYNIEYNLDGNIDIPQLLADPKKLKNINELAGEHFDFLETYNAYLEEKTILEASKEEKEKILAQKEIAEQNLAGIDQENIPTEFPDDWLDGISIFESVVTRDTYLQGSLPLIDLDVLYNDTYFTKESRQDIIERYEQANGGEVLQIVSHRKPSSWEDVLSAPIKKARRELYELEYQANHEEHKQNAESLFTQDNPFGTGRNDLSPELIERIRSTDVRDWIQMNSSLETPFPTGADVYATVQAFYERISPRNGGEDFDARDRKIIQAISNKILDGQLHIAEQETGYGLSYEDGSVFNTFEKHSFDQGMQSIKDQMPSPEAFEKEIKNKFITQLSAIINKDSNANPLTPEQRTLLSNPDFLTATFEKMKGHTIIQRNDNPNNGSKFDIYLKDLYGQLVQKSIASISIGQQGNFGSLIESLKEERDTLAIKKISALTRARRESKKLEKDASIQKINKQITYLETFISQVSTAFKKISIDEFFSYEIIENESPETDKEREEMRRANESTLRRNLYEILTGSDTRIETNTESDPASIAYYPIGREHTPFAAYKQLGDCINASSEKLSQAAQASKENTHQYLEYYEQKEELQKLFTAFKTE